MKRIILFSLVLFILIGNLWAAPPQKQRVGNPTDTLAVGYVFVDSTEFEIKRFLNRITANNRLGVNAIVTDEFGTFVQDSSGWHLISNTVVLSDKNDNVIIGTGGTTLAKLLVTKNSLLGTIVQIENTYVSGGTPILILESDPAAGTSAKQEIRFNVDDIIRAYLYHDESDSTFELRSYHRLDIQADTTLRMITDENIVLHSDTVVIADTSAGLKHIDGTLQTSATPTAYTDNGSGKVTISDTLAIDDALVDSNGDMMPTATHLSNPIIFSMTEADTIQGDTLEIATNETGFDLEIVRIYSSSNVDNTIQALHCRHKYGGDPVAQVQNQIMSTNGRSVYYAATNSPSNPDWNDDNQLVITEANLSARVHWLIEWRYKR